MDRVPRYEMRLTIAAGAAITAPRVFAYSRLPGTDLVSGYGSDGFSRVVAYEPLRPLVSAVTNSFGAARIKKWGQAPFFIFSDTVVSNTAVSEKGIFGVCPPIT